MGLKHMPEPQNDVANEYLDVANESLDAADEYKKEDEVCTFSETGFFVFVMSGCDMVRVFLQGDISLSYLQQRISTQVTSNYSKINYSVGDETKTISNTADLSNFLKEGNTDELPIINLQ